MQVQVSGKHVDVGEALRSRIVDELSQTIGRFFERGGSADVVVTKESHLFRVDCAVNLASGEFLVSHAYGGDAHSAFGGALDKIETRVRRYKRRIKNHHAGQRDGEAVPMTVLRAPADDEADEAFDVSQGPPAGMVVAETEREIKTMTVSMAVMELDLSNYPVILFRNAAHGGLSVVYRRPDGNIGWIDPERTRPGKRRTAKA